MDGLQATYKTIQWMIGFLHVMMFFSFFGKKTTLS